jgi:DNA polymerase-3 subunit beta
MEITLHSDVLGNTLQAVSKLPVKHPSQPYLAYMRLDISGGVCAITVHGIGISCEYQIPVLDNTYIDPVSVALDPTVIVSILGAGYKGVVTITLKDELCVVTMGSSVVECKTFPVDEIERVQEIEGGIPWYKGPGIDLSHSITRVSFACASTDIRPELSSVYLYVRNSQLVSVATDSFTLVEYKTPTIHSDEVSVLIPQKYISDMVKILALLPDCQLFVGEGVCMIRSENCLLVLRTIQGSYPDYEQIIPKEASQILEMSRDDIRGALRTIAPFTDPQFPKIEISVDQESGMCSFVTDYNDKGRGTVGVRSLCTGTHSFPVKINADSLGKVMNSLSVQRVVISCMEGNKPLVITSPDDTSFRALLMPVGR